MQAIGLHKSNTKHLTQNASQNRGCAIFVQVKGSEAAILIGSFILVSFLLGLKEFSQALLFAQRMQVQYTIALI